MRILFRGVAPILIVLGLLVAPVRATPATLSSPDTPTTDRLDDFVRERREALDIPGVAYAVFGPGGVTHSATFGTDGDGERITDTTAFLWGSVAKPVTATLVLELVEAGKVALDEPVVTYLPEFRLADRERSDRITIGNLLAQTSGIPTSLELTDQFDDGRRPGDVVDELADYELRSDPGAEHAYASTNYLVLAAVVEEVTGQRYADALAERVLTPAGMSTAVATAEEAADELPPGHRYVFGQPVAMDTPYDPAGASYGYLGGSLQDLVAFAQAEFTGDVLTADQRDAMFAPVASTGEDQAYGLGWRRWTRDSGDPMIWHGGAVAGYSAAVIWLPEQERGVVMLQNVYGSLQDRALMETGLGLADLLSGKEPAEVETGIGYAASLGGLAAGCLLLIVLAGRSIARIVRPRPRHRLRRTLLALAGWIVALGLVLYGFAVLLPASFGLALGQLWLWTPDVAGLVYTILVCAALLIPLRIAVAARTVKPASPGLSPPV